MKKGRGHYLEIWDAIWDHDRFPLLIAIARMNQADLLKAYRVLCPDHAKAPKTTTEPTPSLFGDAP